MAFVDGGIGEALWICTHIGAVEYIDLILRRWQEVSAFPENRYPGSGELAVRAQLNIVLSF